MCSVCCGEDQKSARPVRMPEYTVLTAIAVVAVIIAELVYFKSGIFRTAQYWWSMVIIFAFQIPVDGWLTKLSAPIVIYNPEEILGLRAPWDIPIEDFGFGFSMVTLAILLWRRWLDRRPATPEEADRQ
jgi:lycopene cyclase domain-containing protein